MMRGCHRWSSDSSFLSSITRFIFRVASGQASFLAERLSRWPSQSSPVQVEALHCRRKLEPWRRRECFQGLWNSEWLSSYHPNFILSSSVTGTLRHQTHQAAVGKLFVRITNSWLPSTYEKHAFLEEVLLHDKGKIFFLSLHNHEKKEGPS